MKNALTITASAVALILTASAVAGQAPQAPGMARPLGEPTLAEVRAATERFRDVRVALAEGFIPDPSGMCVTAEMEGRAATEGAMGIHYFRPDLLGITGPPNPRVSGTGTHTDFSRPAILIYEPQANGSLELVGVENLVFQKAWAQAGHESPPSFHGLPFDRMQDDGATPFDEAHGFDDHFDRHLWIFRDNPLGVFAPMNPNVSCRHHKAHAAH
ncbi:MAG: hypothetical protein KY464_08045 [Gemmatimonadetes bacterium]|nr:hypothetical protein [Gemmatimonadota bacterium]